MSRRTLALVAAAATVLAGAALPARADPARPAVAWTACPGDPAGVRCGRLRVPVDWARPHGATAEIAVARRPAADPDRRIGTLVFGPGGPGDSGVERVVKADRITPELLDRFDLVSLDPRTVGGSDAPDCAPEPDRPPIPLAGPAGLGRAVEANRAYWARCRAGSAVFDHADTTSTARDLDALRRALGERQISFHGSSYGTLLGGQYAEMFPGRVRATVLEGVFDHSLGIRAFVRTQAEALEETFDEFAAWCALTRCTGADDVRALWARALARADAGEFAPRTAFDVTAVALGMLAGPRRDDLAAAITAMAAGTPPPELRLPLAVGAFCADWPAPVRTYAEYQQLLRDAAAVAPDVRYGAGLLAVHTCLGWPQPVRNPPHEPRVHTRTPVLLLNARYDPRTGYGWARHVADQLGSDGRLVTYDGTGHGTYLRNDCTRAMVDRYLIDLIVPPPGATCPA